MYKTIVFFVTLGLSHCAHGSGRLALLVLGGKRALCQREVYESMHTHLIQPLEAAGVTVDAFLHLSVYDAQCWPPTDERCTSGGEGASVDMYGQVSGDPVGCTAALEPLRVRSVHFRPSKDPPLRGDGCDNRTNSMVDRIENRLVWGQLYQLGVAWSQITAYESSLLGQRYDFVLRVRPDSMFFAPFPVGLLNQTQCTYVPYGVMTSEAGAQRLNDHAFFCPRALCAPYFQTYDDLVAAASCPLSGMPDLWPPQRYAADRYNDSTLAPSFEMGAYTLVSHATHVFIFRESS